MTTLGQWVEGARPRTLPAAIAPVAVGTGLALGEGAARWLPGVLALIVALSLQVAVNYANDYSDGIRGTDTDRVGPFRLVGSGAAEPVAVRTAAVAACAVAAVAGLALAAVSSWWLVPVGAACLVGAWGYTGGTRPYGYRALGEVAVFVFFGLVAVVGTYFAHTGRITGAAVVAALPVGLLACALLVVNNLRDTPTDTAAGKRTLAVALGEGRTRTLTAALVTVPFLLAVALGVARPGALVALLAVPLAVPPLLRIRAGAAGRDLVPVLRDTGRLQLVFGLLLGLGLALG